MEQVGANGGEGYARISVRQMYDELSRKLDAMRQEIREELREHVSDIRSGYDGLSTRVAALESRMPRQEELAMRFLVVEKDFYGMEKRFSMHEQAPSHPPMIAQFAALQTEVQQLKQNYQTESTLRQYIESSGKRQDEQRRWMIGLSVIALLNMAGLALAWWSS